MWRTIVISSWCCGAVRGAVLVGPADAAAIGERLILDGCEVGGGGNDIHSVQSHYEPERDRIVGDPAAVRPRAARGDLPRVPRPRRAVRRPAAAATPARTLRHDRGQRGRALAGRPPRRRHQRGRGNQVRFVVPLARLHVGTPKNVPLIPLWATSTLGKVEDRAPNRETGDGCEHPRATTETLVQARVAITGIAFILSYSFTGAIASTPGQAIALADVLCQQDAKSAGFTDTDGIHAWLSNEASTPASYVNPFFGPIQTADGTKVAESISDFANCSPSGNTCLQAPIDKDIHGNPVLNDRATTRLDRHVPGRRQRGRCATQLPGLDLELGQRHRHRRQHDRDQCRLHDRTPGQLRQEPPRDVRAVPVGRGSRSPPGSPPSRGLAASHGTRKSAVTSIRQISA